MTVHLIVEHNTIACNALSLEGYNGDVMRVTLKPIKRTTIITSPHSQERIELLCQAKAHGSIFLATRRSSDRERHFSKHCPQASQNLT
jgi:hypothetical protein